MSAYGLTLKQLRDAMEARGNEALDVYNNLGGASGIASKLKTNTEKGINNTRSEIESRENAFGKNFIPPKKPKTFLELALAAVEDLTLKILIGCAIISLLLAGFNTYMHTRDTSNTNTYQCSPKTNITLYQATPTASTDPTSSTKVVETTTPAPTLNPEANKEPWLVTYAEFIEGGMIVAAILLVILVTAGNDYAKEKQFRGLQDQLSAEQKASVIRSGESLEISVAELVVGDICQVKYGDLLPADGVLIQSNDLKVDESSLTGESDHVKKGIDVDPALLGGTHIMEGSGRMIVTAVGVNSQSGIIFMLLGAGADQDLEENKNSNSKGK